MATNFDPALVPLTPEEMGDEPMVEIEIEDAIYQTKLKSAQDILNYPIKLNDKIADLYNYAESGKTAPTKQVLEAFAELSALADVEINKWVAILKTEIPKLNTMFHVNSLPVFGLDDKK